MGDSIAVIDNETIAIRINDVVYIHRRHAGGSENWGLAKQIDHSVEPEPVTIEQITLSKSENYP